MRPAGLRARGRRSAGESSREHWGGSRRLCGASRELWKGCKTFWKGSGRKILIFQCLSMVLGCQKSPGTSFEAGRSPRARAPARWRVLQGAFGRLQKALWRFQRALGRLQEVLEGFWAESTHFSLVFEGFKGGGRADAGGAAAGLGPPKTQIFKENRKTVKQKGKKVKR